MVPEGPALGAGAPAGAPPAPPPHPTVVLPAVRVSVDVASTPKPGSSVAGTPPPTPYGRQGWRSSMVQVESADKRAGGEGEGAKPWRLATGALKGAKLLVVLAVLAVAARALRAHHSGLPSPAAGRAAPRAAEDLNRSPSAPFEAHALLLGYELASFTPAASELLCAAAAGALGLKDGKAFEVGWAAGDAGRAGVASVRVSMSVVLSGDGEAAALRAAAAGGGPADDRLDALFHAALVSRGLPAPAAARFVPPQPAVGLLPRELAPPAVAARSLRVVVPGPDVASPAAAATASTASSLFGATPPFDAPRPNASGAAISQNASVASSRQPLLLSPPFSDTNANASNGSLADGFDGNGTGAHASPFSLQPPLDGLNASSSDLIGSFATNATSNTSSFSLQPPLDGPAGVVNVSLASDGAAVSAATSSSSTAAPSLEPPFGVPLSNASELSSTDSIGFFASNATSNASFFSLRPPLDVLTGALNALSTSDGAALSTSTSSSLTAALSMEPPFGIHTLNASGASSSDASNASSDASSFLLQPPLDDPSVGALNASAGDASPPHTSHNASAAALSSTMAAGDSAPASTGARNASALLDA